jgi:hypothetical protein
MGGVALVLDLPQVADGHVFAELLHRQTFPSTWRVHNQLQLLSGQISDNEALDAHVSVKAAFRFGMLEVFKVVQMFSLVLQLNSVAAVAMKRYARRASRFPDGRRQGTQDPRVHLTSADPTHFEHDILTFIVMLSISFRLRQRPDLSCPHRRASFDLAQPLRPPMGNGQSVDNLKLQVASQCCSSLLTTAIRHLTHPSFGYSAINGSRA